MTERRATFTRSPVFNRMKPVNYGDGNLAMNTSLSPEKASTLPPLLCSSVIYALSLTSSLEAQFVTPANDCGS